MRLSCPQCHTEYDVPDAALTGRVRTLRCADCGTKFKAPELPAVVEQAPELPPEIPELPPQIPSDAEITAEPDAISDVAFDPVPEAFEPASLEPAPAEAIETGVSYEAAAPLSARRTAPVLPRAVLPQPEAAKPKRALGISILLILLLIGIVLAEHRAIGHAWPPSLRLFDALGLK